jgi:NADH-quinone oxidoreductase subunit G
VGAAWGVEALPSQPGRATDQLVAEAVRGQLSGLVVGGVDPADLPDPVRALAALDAVGFLVSLELRASAVTERADVVLPVAPVQEKAGTYLNWEGRRRPFPAALTSNALPDYRVLDMLADALGVEFGLRGIERVRAELAQLDTWEGTAALPPTAAPGLPLRPAVGEAVLATWHLLLDAGRLQDGEPHLAGTAHRAVARLSAATAAEIELAAGAPITVTSSRGAVTLPSVITAMPDRVVWLPTNSVGGAVRTSLGAVAGMVVGVAPATTEPVTKGA